MYMAWSIGTQSGVILVAESFLLVSLARVRWKIRAKRAWIGETGSYVY